MDIPLYVMISSLELIVLVLVIKVTPVPVAEVPAVTMVPKALHDPVSGFHLGYFVWGGRPWQGGSPS